MSTFTVNFTLVTFQVPPDTVTGADIKSWFLQALQNRSPADSDLLGPCRRDDRPIFGNIPQAISDIESLHQLDISPANALLTLRLNADILGPFPMAA